VGPFEMETVLVRVTVAFHVVLPNQLLQATRADPCLIGCLFLKSSLRVAGNAVRLERSCIRLKPDSTTESFLTTLNITFSARDEPEYYCNLERVRRSSDEFDLDPYPVVVPPSAILRDFDSRPEDG
jgi:hypothetical protein